MLSDNSPHTKKQCSLAWTTFCLHVMSTVTHVKSSTSSCNNTIVKSFNFDSRIYNLIAQACVMSHNRGNISWFYRILFYSYLYCLSTFCLMALHEFPRCFWNTQTRDRVCRFSMLFSLLSDLQLSIILIFLHSWSSDPFHIKKWVIVYP